MTFEEAKLSLYSGWQVKRCGTRYEIVNIIIGKAEDGGFQVLLTVRDPNVLITYHFPVEDFTIVLPGIDDRHFQSSGGLKMHA